MTSVQRLLLLLTALSLAACGFQLRGSDLRNMQPGFTTLHLKAPAESPFVVELRRALLANRLTLGPADQADLILEVISEQPDKQILSLSGSGRVREYLLSYRVSLRAYDPQRRDWLSAEEISLSRILPYDDEQVLAKQQEEILLYKDMRSDAVGQALRRLSRAKPQE